MDIEDLRAAIEGGATVQQAADLLCRADGVEEVVVNAEVVEGRAQPLIIYAERRDKGGAA